MLIDVHACAFVHVLTLLFVCVLTDDGKADDDAKTRMPAKTSLLKVSALYL